MAQYGFRLFLLRLHEGFKPAAVDVSQAGDKRDTHYAEVLRDLVKPQLNVVLDGRPILIDTDDGHDLKLSPGAELSCRWERAKRSGTHASFSLRYGRQGDFDLALNAAEEAKLEDKATTRLYRVELFLPPAGDLGVLAVETVGRTHPTEMFTRWSGLLSRRASRSKAKGGVLPPWWRIKLDPYPDPAQLDQLIANGSKVRLQVTKYLPTASGAGRSKQLVLVEHVHSQSLLKKATDKVKEWTSHPDADGVSDVASLMTPGTVGGMGFTDGEVVIEDESGREKRLSPGKMDEIFVYPFPGLHGERPKAAAWRSEVETKVKALAKEHNLQLDW